MRLHAPFTGMMGTMYVLKLNQNQPTVSQNQFRHP